MQRPHISVNLAISLDGKISNESHAPSGWTSPEDHQRLLELRHGVDALLVGRGTWMADRMTMRAPGNPWRCVVSRSGNFDPGHPMLQAVGGPIHLLATAGPAPQIPGAIGHGGSLEDFLVHLASEGIRTLHCEGGGSLVRQLAALDVIDTLHLTWAGHQLWGGKTSPTLTGSPGEFWGDSREYELVELKTLPDHGEGFLTYRRKREAIAGQ
jgi:2,5-diamino-6-(ribosylamino)-4(3H)-pyrimidinone 5'-phosphate reductase